MATASSRLIAGDGFVDFGPLKDWIAAQEAYQAHFRRPAPLTLTQVNAVAELSLAVGPGAGTVATISSPSSSTTSSSSPLRPAAQAPRDGSSTTSPRPGEPTEHAPPQPVQPPPSGPDSQASAGTEPELDPELDDTNYVGILGEFRQAHPGGTGPTYTPGEARLDPVTKRTKWSSSVVISEAQGLQFPGPGFGLVNGDAPCFFQKKAAKQYAARQALEWLRAQQLTPSGEANGVSFKRQKLSTQAPPSPRQKAPSSSATSAANLVQQLAISTPQGQQQPHRQQQNRAESTTAAAQRRPSRDSSSLLGDEAPLDNVVKLVQELCGRLGYIAPHYQFEPIENTADLFNAWADFGIDNGRFPDGVGRVERIFGKKHAKHALAMQVLEFLEKVEARRRGGSRTSSE